MSGNDILARVRRAVHMADSLHTDDADMARQLLQAIERCREANRQLYTVLQSVHPPTAAGEQARTALLQRLDHSDCGEEMLYRMFDGTPQEAEIHTVTPPGQVQ